ncbi:transmembrane domain-containing protein TMIGD3-like [Pseudoliparis swirei]|uniref:transmembrane domain-containing protein TMIGD3-like n=1 Tax=Pseudoliparis swirei TaxID=2059687 RepID=UPI0024BDA96B|nr:transmembrane domain-containing protein TMIGD3-like [Pseudoliparis swirei]
MILLILVFLLGGCWKTEAMSVTGELGKDVTIKCSHSYAFTNVKYFCKGACLNKVLISSGAKKKNSNDKYSITDEGNTFIVTIFHLTADDSGTYWCGIERIGLDTYKEVVLTVIEGNPQDPDNDLTTTLSSNNLVYIGAGLGVAVLTLAMVLIIFFRHRNKDLHASSGKNRDMVCATVSRKKQVEQHFTTSSSTSNEYQEAEDRTNSSLMPSTVQHRGFKGDHSDDIYSNISGSTVSQIQSDGLFYTTVSFKAHRDSSTEAPGTAALTDSTLKHNATHTSAVYDNV